MAGAFTAPGQTRAQATQIVERLRAGGHEALFAGGCVRDLVMGVEPADFDIATSARPEDVTRLFPRSVLVGAQFGVVRVVEGGASYEVATFRAEGVYLDGRHPSQVTFTSAREDAQRRDFTMNGLFYDPVAGQLIDYVGGQDDLAQRVIRTIGAPQARFEEDHLRLLRAVRFASTLDFVIAPDTWAAVCAGAPRIARVSSERVRDELIKIFTRPHADRGLELLDTSGLLAVILPEVARMKGVEQPPQFHPEGDVLVHTKLLLAQLDRPSVVLAFAALLHDVGKPSTFQVKDRIRFDGHDMVGEQMSHEILTRLRFPNDERERIAACVGNHMHFRDVQQMRVGKLKRFLQRETFAEELELHRIDCLASHGDVSNWVFLQQQRAAYSEAELRPPRLVTGHDLMAAGYPEGPLIGEILARVRDRQLETAFGSREEALTWVRATYPLPDQ